MLSLSLSEIRMAKTLDDAPKKVEVFNGAEI